MRSLPNVNVSSLAARLELIKFRLTFKRIFLSLVIFVCVAWAVFWIYRLIENIGQPQIEYSEGWIVYYSQVFHSGEWIWGIGDTPPFNVSFYTPLYYYLFGELQSHFDNALLVGRILEVVLSVACMGMVYLIVKQYVKSWWIPVLAAFLPLTCATFTAWTMLIRVDMLAVLFELAAIYCVVKYEKAHDTELLWWSIPLFVLAFMTKQSMVAGVVAVTVYLLIKNWRTGLIYGGAFSGGIISIIGIGSLITGGEFLRQILLYQGTNPPFRAPYDIASLLIALFCLALPVFALGFKYVSKHVTSLVSIFVLVALVANIFTYFHPGGNLNYFFESVFALSIAAGCAIPYVLKSKSKSWSLLLLASSLCLFYNATTNMYPAQQYEDHYEAVAQEISDASYPVLSENAAVVLAAGKEPYYEPFVFSNLAHMGYFDENIVLNDLRENRIEYVITQYRLPYYDVQRFSPAVQQAIIENYHIVIDSPPKGVGLVLYEAKNRG